MKQAIFLFTFYLWSSTIFAQDFQLLSQHSFSMIAQVAQDRYGNIYVVEKDGVIHQFDSLGRKLLVYSPPTVAEISLFEARSTVRLFAFYRDLQSYTLLNRFLTPIEHYKFDNESIGFARLANLSADNQLWILDDVDFAIKKFNKNFNQVVLKTPLDLLFVKNDYDINYLCEYQNQLFLNDKNTGILIFDNLGNFNRKLLLDKGIEQFSFLDNEIYFLEKNAIRFLHLYNATERIFPLPEQWKNKTKKVLCQKQRLFLFSESELVIFSHELH